MGVTLVIFILIVIIMAIFILINVMKKKDDMKKGNKPHLPDEPERDE